MASEVTQELARFAAELGYDRIAPSAREHTKNLLLDALACAIAGDRGEETHQVAALAAALAQSREASVIGGDRLSLAGATVLNGYLVTAVTTPWMPDAQGHRRRAICSSSQRLPRSATAASGLPPFE